MRDEEGESEQVGGKGEERKGEVGEGKGGEMGTKERVSVL